MHAPESRIGPVTAITGAVFLFVGTYLHPTNADPNVPLAAFAEYAASSHWVTIHLLQLLGVTLMSVALVLLIWQMTTGAAAPWAVLGMVGAIAAAAVAFVLQAVDGIALKAAVDVWATAPEPARATAFQAAFAVRQIEIGLASMTGLLFGLTFVVVGIALLIDRRLPGWFGIFAIVGGVLTAIGGLAIAYTGFSDLAMTINLPANSALLVWMISWGFLAGPRSNPSSTISAAD